MPAVRMPHALNRLARALCVPVIVMTGVSAFAAPRVPQSDSEVLERLPLRARGSEARELAALRAQQSARPDDTEAAARLARRYFDLAMEQGDPRYVGQAEAVVGHFAQPLPARLLLVRGLLRQYRHDFGGALADFEAALAQDANLADAHAWRGAIFLVQADYLAARNECAALDALGRTVLAAGCQALAEAYGGQADVAYNRLRKALEIAQREGASAANRAWLLTRLGEVAAWRGQGHEAEAHYRAALATGADDAYLLAAWADFLLDAGRADDVLSALKGREAADVLLLRLAEAQRLRATSGPEASREADRLVALLAERFEAAERRGDTTHRGEQARFFLRLVGNAREATRLAAENYRQQREPRDARILLEAALAAHDRAAGQAALDWMERTGFEDAHLRRLTQKLRAIPR